MKRNKQLFTLLILFFILVLEGCKKNDAQDPTLPNGSTPYTAEQVNFVPYTSATSTLTFKKAPDFTEELKLNFERRITLKQVFAWDQTFLSIAADTALKVELKLRYLQTAQESQKTLAVYMPYRDVTSAIQQTIFETPIVPTQIEDGFFENKVTFYDTLSLESSEWYAVFEIEPLTSTPESVDDPKNFSKIYYSKSFGIIAMNQKNGNRWMLHP